MRSGQNQLMHGELVLFQSQYVLTATNKALNRAMVAASSDFGGDDANRVATA